MNSLWYKAPAKRWEEALPLGNGRMGAMFHGGISKELIQLNEETVWFGGYRDRNNPDAKEALPKIRKLILDGHIAEAEKLIKYALSGVPQSEYPYQTLGNWDIEMLYEDSEVSEHDIDEKCEYKRELDISEAIYRCSYKVNGVKYTREAFISAPDDVMVVHISADQKGAVNTESLLTREFIYNTVEKIGTARSHAYEAADNSEETVSVPGIRLFGRIGDGGQDFATELCVVVKGGTAQVIGEHLLTEHADEATFIFSAGTTYNRECNTAPRSVESLYNELNKKLEAAVRLGYDKLKERHIADYQQFFNRVDFQLADSSKYEELPTDERLLLADDIGMDKLYFDFGRYLLISSSRPGNLPANLQGIWCKDLNPPWGSKYTININTEMNYWPAEICNLSDCHMPLFEHIKRMVPHGRVTAEKMYGCRGFVAHHNTDLWGDTAVQDLWIPGSYWVMGAAWLCTHQWTHFQYTKDCEFLKDAFPVMREAALFFMDFLIEDGGYLKTCPSVSPENTFILPNGEKGANTAAVTMDNQILRDLFTQCIEAAKILGVDDDLNEQIKTALSKLMPTRIGSRGQILEWQEEYEEAEPGHRHISHLYGLHPSEQITPDKTPELAEAAKVTLEGRLSHGGGHTGWSRAWIINHYAKLWQAEKAYENYRQLLSKSTLPNLFDNHPPFQIDGNFGGAAGVAEMLVQSTLERIILLPALPKAWNTGSVRGLCVKGGAEIDISWKDCKMTGFTIRAKSDIITDVIYKDTKWSISLAAGEKYSI